MRNDLNNLIEMALLQANDDYDFEDEEDYEEEKQKAPRKKKKSKPVSNPEADKFVNQLTRKMALAAANAFYEETVKTEVDPKRLANILQPRIDQGLTQSFSNRKGLETFLVNLGIIQGKGW